MPDSTTTRLVSLNQQAIAILRLGIPLDLGLGASPIDRLGEINERLLTDIGHHGSADSLLAKHSFPERYCTIAQVLLETDDPAPIFQSIASANLDRASASQPIRQAIAEPLVIAGLVYVGLIFLCLFTVPSIEAQYVQDAQAPGGITRWLVAARELMPYWIVGYPLIIIALWLVWKKLAVGVILDLFPGSERYERWLVAESQSQRLAALVGSGVGDDQALSLAAESVAPRLPIRPIAEGIVRNGSHQNRSAALSRLARFYHFLAEDRRRTYFAQAPTYLGLLLAAIIVFGYALLTFLPWVEVLSNLNSLGAMQR